MNIFTVPNSRYSLLTSVNIRAIMYMCHSTKEESNATDGREAVYHRSGGTQVASYRVHRQGMAPYWQAQRHQDGQGLAHQRYEYRTISREARREPTRRQIISQEIQNVRRLLLRSGQLCSNSPGTGQAVKACTYYPFVSFYIINQDKTRQTDVENGIVGGRCVVL